MNETIGSRICKFRKEKGMTQEELASQLGVSSQAVSKWENDISCPDISLLPQLSRVLGVTTDAILSGKNEEVRVVPAAQRKSLDELVLRIYVTSADGDDVKVNLPMTLVQAGLNLSMDFSVNMGGSEAMKKIDLNQIVKLVQQGAVGKLVEVKTHDGDYVEIVVE